MIEAYISYRVSIAEQNREPRLGYHPMLSNLTTTDRFFVNDEDMGALQELCSSKGWKLEVKPVFNTTITQIGNLVTSKMWTDADTIQHRETVARMYPEREVK